MIQRRGRRGKKAERTGQLLDSSSILANAAFIAVDVNQATNDEQERVHGK
jgi:hypothetical protein